jgi:putative NIF3 family GTP cyclohydrolase 1 type 2
VEGRAQVRRIVCGVTASQALLDAAVARGPMRCWSIMVISGAGRTVVSPACVKRLATLLGNDINLFAYHLPLDAHPELGNAQLGRLMGWEPDGRFGEQDMAGRAPGPPSAGCAWPGGARGWGASR